MSAPPVGTDPLDGARVLAAGGLVAFPTETVYGLGADATNERAVRRIFAVKGRPADHPLIVHLAEAGQVVRWVDTVPEAAWRLAEAFWPGPLTMLLPRGPAVLDVVTGGRATVGLRVPAHPMALALLEAFGGGIAAPSANRFGHVSPTSAAHVVADLDGDVDLVLDGGPCGVGVESTIVDLTGAVPEILRPGGVDADALRAVLGVEPAVWAGSGVARAPGMLEAHYAPRARVVLCSAGELVQQLDAVASPDVVVAVLAPAGAASVPASSGRVVVLEPPADVETFAAVLYARLREADAFGAGVVLVVPPPEGGIGTAVRDRLERAAAASRPVP